MIFGIVGVMEVDVVAEEPTAHWMVAELEMHQRLSQAASITRAGIWREVLEFVRLPLPLLRVRRGRFFDRNIWPDSCVFRIQRQPFLKPGFAISLDGIDGAFRFANATVDAFVRVDDEHVLALVEAVHGAHFDAVHGFAANAALVDDVRQLSVLSTDRSGELIHRVRYRGARSLAENGRRGDLRPLIGSGGRAVGIQGPRSSRLLDCSTSLHRGGRNPGKHRSADAPHSQLQWSALGGGRGASRFALSSRANPPPAPELRTDRLQAFFCPCLSVAD